MGYEVVAVDESRLYIRRIIMASISCLLNGVPWTQGDEETLDDLSPRDQKRVLD